MPWQGQEWKRCSKKSKESNPSKRRLHDWFRNHGEIQGTQEMGVA